MRIFAFTTCMFLLASLNACSSSAPSKADAALDVVENELELVCGEFGAAGPTNATFCTRTAEEQAYARSAMYAQVQWTANGDGSYDKTLISVAHELVDRNRLISLLEQFGFSENDYEVLIERREAITRNNHTMLLEPTRNDRILIHD